MKIAIGCDHAGYELKDLLKSTFSEHIQWLDKGTNGPDSVDYPDFAHAVASSVESADAELGVLICGSANGVAMTANKHQGVRAGIAWQPEIAALAKQHNDANIICIPARFVSEESAKEILKSFLESEFEGGRHQRRTDKIPC